jgi:pSer/pThr/pTyr-binding forkhead associated (FHA) protein
VPEGPVVTLYDRSDDGRRFDIVLTDKMSIGRGDCDVVITGDDALSKRHCELYTKQEKVYVRDLSSSNGTKINGKKIEDSLLNDGDELTVGARDYLVRIA